MQPRFFARPADFRRWLERNAATTSELVVGFHKVGSGRPSMSWPESVDEALCFGWIDGVRKRIDDQSYLIRFTPRKAGSIWSAVNVAKAEQADRAGSDAARGSRCVPAPHRGQDAASIPTSRLTKRNSRPRSNGLPARQGRLEILRVGSGGVSPDGAALDQRPPGDPRPGRAGSSS